MNNQTTYTLERLLKEYKVEIPAIQRDYAFGRKNQEDKRKKFVNEIKKALLSDDNKPPLHLDFIYGKEENEKLFLIDGQQRITTLWLVAVYLTKVSESYNLTSEENKIKNLDKFSYDTRTSSREFCKEILSENLFELDKKGELNSIDFNEQWFFNKKWVFSEWKYNPTIMGMLTVLREINNEFYESISRNLGNNVFDKKWFFNKKWVFSEWKYDPTIMGMFTVLKEIHNELYGELNKLKKGNEFDIKKLMAKIDFSFLNVEELGNPEELYLKMNSRGRQLSEWDDFKAELFKFVDKKDEPIYKDFKYLVDTEFVDLFWEINKEKEFENLNKKTNQSEDDISYKDSPTDKGILKLFKSAVKVEFILNDKKHISKEKDTDDKVNGILKNEWQDSIKLDAIQKFVHFFKEKKDEIKKIDFDRFDESGIRINDLFKSLQGSDSENMSLNELSLFAAYYLFVKNRVNGDLTYDKDDLRQTIRIITNYQGKNYRGDFNDTSENIVNINDILKNKEKSVLDDLKDLKYEENIEDLKLLANKIKENEIKMPSQNVQNSYEEKLKAKMLTSDSKEEWEKIIYECEKNPFSKGSAKWLLEISKKDGEPSLDNANKYYKMLFDEKYLEKESKEEKPLFDTKEGDMIVEKEAALLSYVDIRNDIYNGFFPKGNMSNSPVYSWWSIFKNANYNIYLINGLKEFLKSEKKRNISLKDFAWINWYLKYPILLEKYGTLKLNYCEEGSDFLLKGQKKGGGTKYLLQLEGLKEYLKGNQVNFKTTSSSNRADQFFGYIGKDENDYLYKVTYEFPEDVKYKKRKDFPKNVTEEELKKNEELLYTKQFVIYSKNEKGDDKKEFMGNSDSILCKLDEVAKKLNEVTQNKY